MPVVTFLLIINKNAEEELTEETVQDLVPEAISGAEVLHVWQDPREVSRAVALVDPKGKDSIAASFRGKKKFIPVIAWTEPAESLYVDVKGFPSLQFGTVDKLHMLFAMKHQGGGKISTVHPLMGPGWGKNSGCFQVKFKDGWDAVFRAWRSRCTVEGRKLTVIPLFPCFFKDRVDQIQNPPDSPIKTAILKDQPTGREQRKDLPANAQETPSKPFSYVSQEREVPLRDGKMHGGTKDIHARDAGAKTFGDIQENQDQPRRKSMDRDGQAMTRSKQNTAAAAKMVAEIEKFDQGRGGGKQNTKADIERCDQSQGGEESTTSRSVRDLARNFQDGAVKTMKGWGKNQGQSRGEMHRGHQGTDIEETASKNLAAMEREDQERQRKINMEIEEEARKYLAKMEEEEEQERQREGNLERTAGSGPKYGLTTGHMWSRSTERRSSSPVMTEMGEKYQYDSSKGEWKEDGEDAMQDRSRYQTPVSETPQVDEKQWSKKSQGRHEADKQNIVDEMNKEAQKTLQNVKQRMTPGLPDSDEEMPEINDDEHGTSFGKWGGGHRVYPGRKQNLGRTSSQGHGDKESRQPESYRDKSTAGGFKCTYEVLTQHYCQNRFLGWLLHVSKCDEDSGLQLDYDYDEKIIFLLSKYKFTEKEIDVWAKAIEAECQAWKGKAGPSDVMTPIIKDEISRCLLTLGTAGNKSGQSLMIAVNERNLLSIPSWVDHVCGQKQSDNVYDKHYKTPTFEGQGQGGKTHQWPEGWSREDITFFQIFCKEDVEGLDQSYRSAGLRLLEDCIILSDPNAYEPLKQNLAYLLRKVKTMRKEFNRDDSKKQEDTYPKKHREMWPKEWSQEDINFFLENLHEDVVTIEKKYHDIKLELNFSDIILSDKAAFSSVKYDLLGILYQMRQRPQQERKGASHDTYRGREERRAWPTEWSKSCIKFAFQFLSDKMENIVSKYSAAGLQLFEDRIVLSDSNACQAVKEDLTKLRRQVKSKQEMFNFPDLERFMRSDEGKEMARIVSEQFCCLVDFTATQGGNGTNKGESASSQDSLEIQSTHYSVTLLETLMVQNIKIHLTVGQAIDMDADLVVNVETAGDVKEAQVKHEDRNTVSLLLPNWQAGKDVKRRKAVLIQQRVKLRQAMKVIVHHVDVNNVEKLVIGTEGVKKPGLTFPIDELAEAFVEVISSTNITSQLNVYVCEARRMQVHQSFKYFFRRAGFFTRTPSEDEWKDIASEVIMPVPNYASLAKDRDISVTNCKDAPTIRDKWYSGSTSSYQSYNQSKRLICIPVTEEFDNAAYWSPELKKEFERCVAPKFPDGLLPGQTCKMSKGQDEILLYGSPYGGIGTQKIMASVIDECIGYGNGQEVYICLPKSKHVLSQTVFACLDSWVASTRLKRGTKIFLYSGDNGKAMAERLTRRTPKPKSYLSSLRGTWNSFMKGTDEKDNENEGGRRTVKTEPQSTRVTFLATSDDANNQACNKLHSELLGLMKDNKREFKLSNRTPNLHPKIEKLLKEARSVEGHIKYHANKKKRKGGKNKQSNHSGIELVLSALTKEWLRYFLADVEQHVGSEIFYPPLAKQQSNYQRSNSYTEGTKKQEGGFQRSNSVNDMGWRHQDVQGYAGQQSGYATLPGKYKESQFKPREACIEDVRHVRRVAETAPWGDGGARSGAGQRDSLISEDSSLDSGEYEDSYSPDEAVKRDNGSSVDLAKTERQSSGGWNAQSESRAGKRHSGDWFPDNKVAQRSHGVTDNVLQGKDGPRNAGDSVKTPQGMAGGNAVGAKQTQPSLSSDAAKRPAPKMSAAYSTESLADRSKEKSAAVGSRQRYLWLVRDSKSSGTKFVACSQEQSCEIERLYSQGCDGVQFVCGEKVDFSKLVVIQNDLTENCLIRRENINPQSLDEFNDQVPEHWPESGKFKAERIKDSNKIGEIEKELQEEFPGKEVEITKMEELQNSELLKRFHWKMHRSEDLTVRQMWHRIDPQYKRQVCEFGLHYISMALPEGKRPKSKKAVCWFFEDAKPCVSEKDVHDETEIYLVRARVLTSEEGPQCSIPSDAMAVPQYLVMMTVKV